MGGCKWLAEVVHIGPEVVHIDSEVFHIGSEVTRGLSEVVKIVSEVIRQGSEVVKIVANVAHKALAEVISPAVFVKRPSEEAILHSDVMPGG